jgi:very-short-patch-repair endonuclease
MNSYPMVFYPESIEKFCRQYPLPPLQLEVGEVCDCEIGKLKGGYRWGEFQVSRPTTASPHRPIVLPTKFLSAKLLLTIWLFWLSGVVALFVLAVGLGWSWFGLLSLGGAYSCLMAAAYTHVLNSRVQVLSECRQLLKERSFQESKIISSLPSELSNKGCQFVVGNNRMTRLDSAQYEHQLKLRCQALAALMRRNLVKPIGRSNARQGVSEEQFLRYLQCYFEEVVQAAEFKISLSRRNYAADFIVLHSQSGIGIAVEVDEPYAGRSKKPTHCCDGDSDIRRNQLFLEWNWIVIRFTEKQVVQAPLSCCKFIATAIAAVTGDRSCLKPLESEPDLLSVKPWTTASARQMAKSNYRLSYLPNSLKNPLR